MHKAAVKFLQYPFGNIVTVNTVVSHAHIARHCTVVLSV